jgi:ubiquinone/menaquinone biosynthesis C-methylase UbiE
MNRRPEPELMDLPAEAAAYAAADFSAVNAAFVEHLLKLAGTRSDVHAVDLGTGPGDIAIRVARARPSWRVIAVDASEPMLAVARQAAGDLPNLRLASADAKASGFPDRSFDLIFSNSLLHHMPDPLPLWRAIARLAAPGATIFVRDLMRPASEDDARRLVELHAGGESALLKEEFHRSLLAAFTVEEVRTQLAATALHQLTVAVCSDRHLEVFGAAIGV